MRLLIIIITITVMLLPAVVHAQTATVTGHVIYPSGGAPTNARVCVTLQNYKPNLPRVTSTGVVINQTNYCQSPATDGSFSFSLIRNDLLAPVGTFWRVDFLFNGIQSSSATYLINHSPFNLDTETPLSQAVIAGPNQTVTECKTFLQVTPTITWTFTHGENDLSVFVQTVDLSGNSIFGHVNTNDPNTAVITWAVATSGRAMACHGGSISIATNQPNAIVSNPAGSQTIIGPQILNIDAPTNFSTNIAFPHTSSSSSGVITFGGTSFIHDFPGFGFNDTFVGSGAGNFTLSGTFNSGFGSGSLQGLTSGNSNTAFGAASLGANTNGGGNAAFGDSSLGANTTGISNSAFGHFALKANTTGGGNSAFGTLALSSLVGGINTNSSAFGIAALLSATTGTNNNAFGTDALRNITTGSNNMAFGVAPGAGPGAAYASSESNNIVIGNVGIVGESNVIRIGTGGTHLSTFLSGAVFLPQVGNAAGLQIFNTTTTCTTGASVGATCTTAAITLPAPETDTAYRVVCTGKGLTNVPVVIATTNSSATQFTITIAALTAAAASFASYDCTAGHN